MQEKNAGKHVFLEVGIGLFVSINMRLELFDKWLVGGKMPKVRRTTALWERPADVLVIVQLQLQASDKMIDGQIYSRQVQLH